MSISKTLMDALHEEIKKVKEHAYDRGYSDSCDDRTDAYDDGKKAGYEEGYDECTRDYREYYDTPKQNVQHVLEIYQNDSLSLEEFYNELTIQLKLKGIIK